MKIGVNLWTIYGWNLPEPVSLETLRAIGAMGAQGVELVLDEKENSADSLLARRATIQATLREAQLEVPSVATTLFHRYNLGAQDSAARQRALDLINDGCRVAQAYGARVLLVVAGQQEPQTEYRRTYASAVESLRRGGVLAADLGITLAIENVSGGFLGSPGEYIQFIEDIGHPAVQAYVDPGNGAALGNGYPENWVTAVQGHIAMVHAKDYDRTQRVHVLCGQGELGWDRILETLRAVGYDDFVTVETPPLGGRGQIPLGTGLAAAETSVRWLKQWV